MRTRITTAVLTAALAFSVVACEGETTTDGAGGTPAPSSSAPSVSAEDLAKAREAAGLPPKVTPAARAAYVKALNAISLDIVHGKADKAVSRGYDVCSSIKNFPGDRDKQVEMTGQRFTSPTHPEGRDKATAGKILDLTHKHICPKF
jgi:hypothetical protein